MVEHEISPPRSVGTHADGYKMIEGWRSGEYLKHCLNSLQHEQYGSEADGLRLGEHVALPNPEAEFFMNMKWADRAGISGSVCLLRDTRTTSLPHNSTTTCCYIAYCRYYLHRAG